MPQAVGGLVFALAAVGLPDAALGIKIGHIGELVAEAALLLRVVHDAAGFDATELPAEIEMLLLRQFLSRKNQYGVFPERGFDGREILGGERLREINVADFRNKSAGDGMNGDGHEFLRDIFNV